ncbi:hypothetical protein ABZP36_016023 [Zizania latifolia]
MRDKSEDQRDRVANALKLALKKKNLHADIYVGMRYWHPFTEEAIDQIKKDKITKLVFHLYSQYSISTSGSSIRVLQNIVSEELGARQYIVLAFSNIIHDSFEPLEGPLLSGHPVEVSSSWSIVLEAAYLRTMYAPGGFLFEWWSIFWDIFIARTNEKHLDVAASYIEWIDKEGKMPLMVASMRLDLLNLVKVLIELGGNVLDDSDDPTMQTLIREEVMKWQENDARIVYRHRVLRDGYKAGNLKSAMSCSYVKDYEFVAIFDADFQSNPDFLKRTVPHFKILPFANAFYRGLSDLISPSWLSLFNANEFNQNSLATKVEKSGKQMKEQKNRTKKICGVKKILDTNPQLYFHLQQQKLIELIRAGKINEALEFAQEELAPRGEENEFKSHYSEY